MPRTEKYVTKEYHEGKMAYLSGLPLASNPYLAGKGDLWYWMFGWQDAMAEDLRHAKQLLLTILEPINKEPN
tara:strand:+ start:213 stop:428 length:216 start_codon:yes stop_codon:yes gene_type:complete